MGLHFSKFGLEDKSKVTLRQFLCKHMASYLDEETVAQIRDNAKNDIFLSKCVTSTGKNVIVINYPNGYYDELMSLRPYKDIIPQLEFDNVFEVYNKSDIPEVFGGTIKLLFNAQVKKYIVCNSDDECAYQKAYDKLMEERLDYSFKYLYEKYMELQSNCDKVENVDDINNVNFF